MHKLTIEDDEGKTVVVPLIRDEISVGRLEGNSIRLTERNVSRRHARLFRQAGAIFVEDLGSYNGIKVNGTRVSAPTQLRDGDTIVVGDYRLSIHGDRPAAVASPSAGNPAVAASPAATPAPIAAPAPSPPTALAASLPPPEPEAPAPEASLDGAPTIPVRTLAEQGLVPGQSPPAPPGRLVVLSGTMAGTEFVIDRASLVIGRTTENDVVLTHKSISRHHAKLIREGDRHVIVDLESANGVRVNGTEFERVELQSGDVVELGHVRLRFVAAGDVTDFAELEATAQKKKKQRLMILAGAATVTAGVILVAVLAGGGSPDPSDSPATTATATAQTPATKSEPRPAVTETPAAAPAAAVPPAEIPVAPPTAAAPVPPAPVPPAAEPIPAAPPPAPNLASATAIIAEAKAAIARERWDDALAAVKRALAVAPSADLLTLRETVEAERKNAWRFAALDGLATKKDYAAAAEAMAGIPEASVYHPRAASLLERTRISLVAEHVGEAQRLQGQGDCVEARREVDRVLALDPSNASAKRVIDRCERAAERPAARTVTVKAPTRPAPRIAKAEVLPPSDRPIPRHLAPPTPPSATLLPPASAPPPPTAVAPAPAVDSEALIQEARSASLKGQYAAALEMARKVLKVKPNHPQAQMIVGVCSCSLRDAASAKRAYEKVDDRTKPLIKSMCQKNGISLD